MIEPIYEYVRGKGWIITKPETHVMRCGTLVTLEHRMPNSDEAWLRSRGWFIDDNTPNYDLFRERLDDYTYQELLDDRSGSHPGGLSGTVTIVKL